MEVIDYKNVRWTTWDLGGRDRSVSNWLDNTVHASHVMGVSSNSALFGDITIQIQTLCCSLLTVMTAIEYRSVRKNCRGSCVRTS